jgi:hypothetical protein
MRHKMRLKYIAKINNLESQSAATKTTKPILNFGGHNVNCGAKVANLVS